MDHGALVLSLVVAHVQSPLYSMHSLPKGCKLGSLPGLPFIAAGAAVLMPLPFPLLQGTLPRHLNHDTSFSNFQIARLRLFFIQNMLDHNLDKKARMSRRG